MKLQTSTYAELLGSGIQITANPILHLTLRSNFSFGTNWKTKKEIY